MQVQFIALCYFCSGVIERYNINKINTVHQINELNKSWKMRIKSKHWLQPITLKVSNHVYIK